MIKGGLLLAVLIFLSGCDVDPEFGKWMLRSRGIWYLLQPPLTTNKQVNHRSLTSVLIVTLTNKDNKAEESSVSYSGGQCACLGLARVAGAKILRDAISEEEE